MMRKLFMAATALVTLPCFGSQAAAPSGVLEAGIVHGALVAGPAGGTLTTIATGGPARGMPAISPDGTRIAFVQLTDKRVALADVVVVDMNGHVVSRTKVEPVIDNTAYSGMQAIEALRWISPDRIAVRGSINPSQSQYYVIQASTGRIVADFTDDASSAAFSQDGLHVAALSGSPHFGPGAPVLAVDGKTVWQAPAGATLAGGPSFSPDGASLAWAARDAAGHATLDVWNGAAVRQAAVPAAADAALDVGWRGTHAVVTTQAAGRTLAWAETGDGRASPVVAAAPANTARERLADQARAAGVNEANFWGVK